MSVLLARSVVALFFSPGMPTTDSTSSLPGSEPGDGSFGSGRDLRKEGIDFRAFPRAEAELGRPGHVAELAGPPRAHDRPGHGRVAQHPGDGHFGGRAAV